MNPINRILTEYALAVAGRIGAQALLLNAGTASELADLFEERPSFEIVLLKKGNEEISAALRPYDRVLTLPDVRLTRMGSIKIAITKGIAQGIFKKGDKLVCLAGIPKFGYADSLFIIDVGKEFELLTSQKVSDILDEVHPEVFGSTLNIALELSAQGRAGRKVGTIFVLGDHEKVLQLSRQMIINPFMGYGPEDRIIFNPDLKETIKELAAIDGAFVIDDHGFIITAGRHLSAALDSREFPHGLGSRHIAAAGITGITDAVAIVLSESTGNVTVFKDGRIFVTIEKPTE
jgi:DNA integrity scanning protein DisA with diadenylate cyclase activity